MKRILFVDDEPAVLDGLRLRLRRMRNEWEMSFAEGPFKGLDALRDVAFDAVVSDIQMPGMDGVEFLKRVRVLQPPAVRIALSGQTRSDSMVTALSVAHQFLAKPAEPERLEASLRRAWALQDRIHNVAISSALERIDLLPPVPAAFASVTRALESPEVDLRGVAAIVAGDMAMSAKLLKVLNSPYFGLQTHVTDVRDAVTYLGVDCARSLLLAFGMEEAFAARGYPKPLLPGQMQEHALATAAIAARLMPDGPERRIAYSAGVLHDIGKLALASLAPEGYAKVLEQSRNANVPVWWAEEAILGFSHAEAGGYLLAIWGLPYPVVEAMAGHHRPERGIGRLTAGGAVYVANRLSEELSGAPEIEEWDTAFLSETGMDSRLESLRNELREAGHGPGKEER